MGFHQRPKRRVLHLEAVAGIGAAFAVLMAELGLAVMQRVVGREVRDPGPGRLVQGVVGGAHVGEAGLAAFGRHDVGGEDRALGLHRHVGGIAVPAHVALQHLDHVVAVVVGAEGPVGAHVGDRREVELQGPEPAGEGDLLLGRQMLAREDQERVVEPGLVEHGEVGVGEGGEPQAGDHRAEGGGQGFDIEGPGHRGIMNHGKSGRHGRI